jgi:hypothetical protein
LNINLKSTFYGWIKSNNANKNFFFQFSNSEKLIDKELAMVLLSVIIEYFSADEIKNYYDALNKIIESHLQSGIVSLQSLAIETVNKIA